MPISIYKKRLLCAALALFSAAFAFLPAAAEEVPSGIIGFSPKVEEPAEAEEPAEPEAAPEAQEAPGGEAAEAAEEAEPGETTAEEFDFPDTYPAYLAPQYAKETPEGVAYLMAEDGSHMMAVGWRGEGKTITVPETIDGLPVTEIMATAFSGTEKVENIILPNSIEIIGKFAFAQMPQLISVKLPEGITEIPDSCFENARSLSKIVLPETLKSIGNSAFSGCLRLGLLKMPASVDFIGVDAFFACEGLILDCTENEYAQRYAAGNSIEATGGITWNSMVLQMLFSTVLIGAGVYFVPRIVRKYRKKAD
ncbi:MAG TPA: leucine-rich repeat domain-containing protein [Clostridiales bacterium]|jgi:hypothetical protein|nr:leucine-rich repeat domain-containing protein [Clostridiales bacterium]